jgi:hypothetical protein
MSLEVDAEEGDSHSHASNLLIDVEGGNYQRFGQLTCDSQHGSVAVSLSMANSGGKDQEDSQWEFPTNTPTRAEHRHYRTGTTGI